MSEKSNIGTIGWIDLTVPDAVVVREFYQKVVGWDSAPISMGEYDDFCMLPKESDDPVCGVCHAKGSNKEIPPQWMIYIVVEELEKSLQEVKSSGGELVSDIKTITGQGSFCIIKDPAGAMSALYQEEKK